jgi:alkyl hydroperoxide reductase subunit AhpC
LRRRQSVNDLISHRKWIEDIDEISNTNSQFHIIADTNGKIAYLYDMLDAQDLESIDEKGIHCVHYPSVFIIDPARKIRLTMMYPESCGRNTTEV